MKIVKYTSDLQNIITDYKALNKTIGFVPTMGALHQGHLSLIREARKQSDVVVCSIFVNPTQFNDAEDFEKYPRNTDRDLEMIQAEGCDIAFVPSVEEMYPETDERIFRFGHLEEVMEGRFRKGHFNGVAQVVSKLFDMVQPDKAFFGQKDFQQYVIIKDLVRQLSLPIKIVPCPIIREPNGLAMSSRNERLSHEQRELASEISKALFWAKENYLNYSVEDVKTRVAEKINGVPELELEYVEIVDDTQLEPIQDWAEKSNKVACVAVFCGKVRLIDNIVLNL